MIIKSLIIYSWLIPCALAQSPCVTVTGDQILGSDLARAIPAFARIPANTPLATSPLPGSTRTFSLSELQSFAARFAVPDRLAGRSVFSIFHGGAESEPDCRSDARCPADPGRKD